MMENDVVGTLAIFECIHTKSICNAPKEVLSFHFEDKITLTVKALP